MAGHSGVSSTPPVFRPCPTLPEYDGQLDYSLFRVQAAAILSPYSDSEAATALIACLRRSALELLRTLPEAHRTSHGLLDAALMEAFGQSRSSWQAGDELEACRQNAGESVRRYATRLQALHREVFGTIIDETPLLNKFYRGLRDQQLSRECRFKEFSTLREALAWCSCVGGDTFICAPVRTTELIATNSESSSPPPIATPAPTYSRKPVCYRCKVRGHIARDCN